jgi:uncharacterized membrane protein
MKVLCTDHIDVAVPADRAFAAVADISRWPVWFSSVVCAQHPDSLPVALGEELSFCINAGKRRWRETFEVTRFVPGAFLSLEGAFSAARRIDFRFEQRGAMTRIACAIGYPVFGGVLGSIVDAAFKRRRVRADLCESLQRLRGLLEEVVEPITVGDDLGDMLAPPNAHRPLPAPPIGVKEPAGAT